jgi:hypothetical protein
MKFAPDGDFCSTRKDLKSDFGKVTPKGVKMGVKGGQNGVILITGSFCVPIELSS